MNFKFLKTDQYNEAEYLAKAQLEHDLDSASVIYSQYVDLIYGVSLKYLKSKERAEDAVMDIYHEFLEKVKSHSIENVKSWLYVVTKNHCLMKLRKEKWVEDKKTQLNIVYSDEYYHPNFNEEDGRLDQLKLCMGKLKNDQKTCVNLFYYEKKSYLEISKMQKMEMGTVRSHIQNGRRNLKNCIENS